MARVTTPLAVKLDDTAADRVRVSHARAISELQDSLFAQAGIYLGRQTLRSSGTYVPTPGTKRVVVRGAACGGGGGGAGAGAGAGGGAAGDYFEGEFSSTNDADIAGGLYSAPTTGGAGGTTAGTGGTAGSDATLTVAGQKLVLKGGGGGQGMTGGGGDGAAFGGQSQAGGTSGVLQAPGKPSIRWSAGAAWLPGGGGQTLLSGEALAVASGVTAPAGSGAGGGGAGGFGSPGTGSAGGAGAGAVWIIHEFGFSR